MHFRLDRRQFGHLVAPGLGVHAAQRVSTPPAFRRLAVGDRGEEPLGVARQSPHPADGALLATAALLGRRDPWSSA